MGAVDNTEGAVDNTCFQLLLGDYVNYKVNIMMEAKNINTMDGSG